MYSFDPVGSYQRDSFKAGGSASAMLQPLLDNQVRTLRAVVTPLPCLSSPRWLMRTGMEGSLVNRDGSVWGPRRPVSCCDFGSLLHLRLRSPQCWQRSVLLPSPPEDHENTFRPYAPFLCHLISYSNFQVRFHLSSFPFLLAEFRPAWQLAWMTDFLS